MRSDQADATNIGWAVAHGAVEEAQRRFSTRLRSSYALGSLAHGGFSPLVSDVDVALVLADFADDDQAVMAGLVAAIKATGIPLAERLSVFWGTIEAIGNPSLGGRFPPLDRLDLIQHGRLITGEDIRGHLLEPSLDELVVAAARFAIDLLGEPERRREITEAGQAAAAGARTASKVALFPVRFLFTAQVGGLAENELAATHYLSRSQAGPRADLVRAALTWRTTWDARDHEAAERLLRAAAVPLYQEFAAVYVDRLAAMGEHVVAEDLASWARTLQDA